MSGEVKTESQRTYIYDPYGFHVTEEAMCDAVKAGNLKQLSQFIADNVNLNFIDHFGKTALHYAIKQGNYETVKLLVGNGADVNIHDANFTTPLHLAARGNHVNITRFLLLSGAAIKAKTRSDCMPIDLAAYNTDTWQVLQNAMDGNLPTVEYLCQTRTVPLVPWEAVKREIERNKEKMEKLKQKKTAKKKKK